MPLITINLNYAGNFPFHTIEINDTVITLFYKPEYSDPDICCWSHPKDIQGNEYRFLKDNNLEHKNLHQDMQLKNLFHHHYDLGRLVDAQDVNFCLRKQIAVIRKKCKNLDIQDYNYESITHDFNFELRRKKEGFQKLEEGSETILLSILKRQNNQFFGEYNRSNHLNALLEIKQSKDKLCAKKIQKKLGAGEFYHQGTLFVLDGINMPCEHTRSHNLAAKIYNV